MNNILVSTASFLPVTTNLFFETKSPIIVHLMLYFGTQHDMLKKKDSSAGGLIISSHPAA
jgi:hypothetical protein